MIGWLRATFRAFREESEAIEQLLDPTRRTAKEYAARNRGNAPAHERPTFRAASSDSARCWHCGQSQRRHLAEGHCRREDLASAPWAPRGAR